MEQFNSLRKAAKYAGVSYQTILNWTSLYDIGTLHFGRVWVIDKDKLDRVIAARARIAGIEASLLKSA